MSIEKLPVPEFELLTADVGSEFQQKMNAAMLGVKNAIIAFNAQIDANETSTDRVSQMNSLIQQVELDSNNVIVQVLTSTDAEVEVEFGGQTQLVVPYGHLQQQVVGSVNSAAAYAAQAIQAKNDVESIAANYGIIPDLSAEQLALVSEDAYFSIPAPDSSVYLRLYRKIDGVAVPQNKEYPTSEALRFFLVNFNLAQPAITDSTGSVELLSWDDTGAATFRVSAYVMSQLISQFGGTFANKDQVQGVTQEPLNKIPGIFDAAGVELFGFDKTGAALFKVSRSVADQVVKLIGYAPFNPVLDGLLPKSDISAWGDSMTQSAGGGGTTITAVISSILGRPVTNRGIGGQDATAIAIRQGGTALFVTVQGNTIPAAGSVPIVSKTSNILSSGGNFTGTAHVSIGGVPGIISTDSSGNWSFLRSVAGEEVVLSGSTQAVITDVGTGFIPAPGPRRADTSIIWAGRNGVVGLGRSAAVNCRNRILDMAMFLTPKEKRFLVVSVCNGRRLRQSDNSSYEPAGSSRYNDVIALNKELFETFRESYVDLRHYMVNFAIYDAGLAPTPTDLADIAADCIPTQLLADDVHFTATGYQMAGQFLARQILARGW